MKSVPKLIRRFVGILLLSCVLLLVLNLALLILFTARQMPNVYPWKAAEEIGAALQKTDGGAYALSAAAQAELEESGAWAILIDNETRRVVWQSGTLPDTIPISYTLSDIAGLTRGYLDGYPTFTGEAEDGLVVLGYPRDRFWKHMWPSWDYEFIANLPKTALSVLGVNAALIFLIYMLANSRLLKSIRPIVSGIQALPTGEAVHVRETGLLSELAGSINETSEILQAQSAQLRRRETARANWIAGVSHDIRTPLSMVMGYAGQMKDDGRMPEEERRKAELIVRQSQRIKDLINDLNLASKLEYNMQPVHPEQVNMVAAVRQIAVDYLNMDIDDKYPIAWETDAALSVCPVNADKALIRRAVGNLIQNCVAHNEQGCTIHIGVAAEDGVCTVTVADDGVGAADDQLEKLNNAPHYMVCDENTVQQRHGLGLLLVKQIMQAHGGTAVIGRSIYGGFSVTLRLPAANGGQQSGAEPP